MYSFSIVSFFSCFPYWQSKSFSNLYILSFLSTVILPPSDVKSSEQKDELPVDIKLPVKHILSRELQVNNFLFAYIILLKFN